MRFVLELLEELRVRSVVMGEGGIWIVHINNEICESVWRVIQLDKMLDQDKSTRR